MRLVAAESDCGASAVVIAKAAYAERRRRNAIFPQGLFREPHWDVLIDLFVAGSEGRRISATSATIAGGVPLTSGLRYLTALADAGMIERYSCDDDRRSSFVRLTDDAHQLMMQYFGA